MGNIRFFFLDHVIRNANNFTTLNRLDKNSTNNNDDVDAENADIENEGDSKETIDFYGVQIQSGGESDWLMGKERDCV